MAPYIGEEGSLRRGEKREGKGERARASKYCESLLLLL
jgi:hypothetical protein